METFSITTQRIHPRLDEKLVVLMKMYCRCKGIYMKEFLSEAIADKLQVKLNENYSVNMDKNDSIILYINELEVQIKELDTNYEKTRNELEKKKQKILE